MKKIIPYVSREEVHERLMANPMAKSYWDLTEDKQNGYLDDVMNMQFKQAAEHIVQTVAYFLYVDITAIPLHIKLKYTASRVPLLNAALTPFSASNIRKFV